MIRVKTPSVCNITKVEVRLFCKTILRFNSPIKLFKNLRLDIRDNNKLQIHLTIKYIYSYLRISNTNEQFPVKSFLSNPLLGLKSKYLHNFISQFLSHVFAT